MKRIAAWLLASICIVPLAFGDSVEESTAAAAAAASVTAEAAPADPNAPATSETTAKKASELSERLIYSVDRVPERTFDTARAVEVITVSDLWRKSGMDLAEVLEHEAGVAIDNYDPNGGVPMIRGLHGKQIMIMIDGVKVNDAMWRSASKDYLGIIQLSQVERIEVVRGVVSVLGTEALGGVINIITKQGPPDGETFGGTIGARYQSAASMWTTPIEVYGQSGSLRWNVSGSYLDAANNHGGGDVGVQPNTSYNAQGFHAAAQYLLSQDKTIVASYQGVTEANFQRAWQLAQGDDLHFNDGPSKFKLASLSYQDLTDRTIEDSFRVRGYFNRQDDGRDEIRTATPTVRNYGSETDNLGGLNLEFGKFLFSSHHFLYGIDATTETIHSKAHNLDLKTGKDTSIRGRYTDGAEYRTAGVYLQDRFDAGKWLTTTVGVRYGTFQSIGEENSTLGVISLNEKKADTTGALNLVFHATPNFNLIANGMRGYRAPNIDELSRFSVRSQGTDFPNPDAGAEHVKSFELGAKYESSQFSSSVFYYNNDFSDLLIRLPGTFKGLPFVDSNGNGRQDAKEAPVYQLQNVGTAKITGFEADFRYAPRSWFNVSGNVTQTHGDDTYADQPLERVPPVYGTLMLSVFGSTESRLWGELSFDFAGSQHRLSPNDISNYRIGADGTEGYKVFGIRGGATLINNFRLMVGVDNLTDRAYKTHDSFVYRPARQLVVSTEYRF